MNPKVDFFFEKAKKWQEELEKLRTIALGSGLDEVLKWGCPCYTYQENNIVLIHAFKEYCALLFFKGVLMKDEKGILIQQTENVQASRQLRFTNLDEINELAPVIKAYIHEAVEIEKSGQKAPKKQTREFEVPEEFQQLLDGDPEIEKAFKALTPGRQRAYLLYFGSAKQAKTREARIEKYVPAILEGKGMDD